MTREECFRWPRGCEHFDDLACLAEELDVDLDELPTPPTPWRYVISYWLRPYDAHLDARRWRWQEPGCSRSRKALAVALASTGGGIPGVLCEHGRGRSHYTDPGPNQVRCPGP